MGGSRDPKPGLRARVVAAIAALAMLGAFAPTATAVEADPTSSPEATTSTPLFPEQTGNTPDPAGGVTKGEETGAPDPSVPTETGTTGEPVSGENDGTMTPTETGTTDTDSTPAETESDADPAQTSGAPTPSKAPAAAAEDATTTTPEGSDISVTTTVEDGFSYKSNVLTISQSGDYTLTMASDKVGATSIVITDAYKSGTITLNGLNLNVGSKHGIDINEGAIVTLKLVGENKIISGETAIRFPGTTKNLTITSDPATGEGSFDGWAGSLHAETTDTSWYAAIGGDMQDGNTSMTLSGGKITTVGNLGAALYTENAFIDITAGTVIAKGDDIGIGSRDGKAIVSITGSANVTASGEETSIGSTGGDESVVLINTTGTVNAPNGIGGSSSPSPDTCDIDIINGTVIATGTGRPAIGGCGSNTIDISGGTVNATAVDGSWTTTAIGGTLNQSATVTITGGRIVAKASGKGPIGIGSNNSANVSITNAEAEITINGDSGIGIGSTSGTAKVTIGEGSNVTVNGTGSNQTGIGAHGTSAVGDVTIQTNSTVKVIIKEGDGSTGIGSYGTGSKGTVTINGGDTSVDIEGDNSTGVGGYTGTGTVSVNGGSVTVLIKGNDSTGLGSHGTNSADGTVSIVNGEVSVTVTGDYSTGIGTYGFSGESTSTISGGKTTVNVNGKQSAGIGTYGTSSTNTVTITGGDTIVNVGGDKSTGIGNSGTSSRGTANISGGGLTVKVTGDQSTGIGGAVYSSAIISGGAVTAETKGKNSVAIQGSDRSDSVTVTGGTVTATATDEGSVGIGGQEKSNVIITGGVVKASGEAYGIGDMSNGTRNTKFSTTDAEGNKGNAVIKSNTPIKDQSQKENWQGVIFENKAGTVHGKPAPPSFTIETDETLTVPSGSELTLNNGVTVTNNGVITVAGKITGKEGAKIENEGENSSIKVETGGTVEGGKDLITGENAHLTVDPTADNLPDLTKLDFTYDGTTDYLEQVKAAALVSGSSTENGPTYKFPATWRVKVLKDGKEVVAVTDAGAYVVQLVNGEKTLTNDTMKVTVKKAASTVVNPTAPTVDAEKSANTTVVLNSVDNAEYQAKKAADENWPDKWQDSPTFSGLAAETEYEFRLRDKGDANHEPSDPSVSAKHTTGKRPVTPGGGGSGGGSVTVRPAIEVSSKPDKLEYGIGEKFNPSGMVVKASGRTLTVDQYTVSGFDSSKPGEVTVTVALKSDPSKTASFDVTVKASDIQIHRLYVPWTGEHFYTASEAEWKNLTENAGWRDEGIAFTMSDYSETPVYRLYQPGGKHMFTTNKAEYEHLKSAGWRDEGVAFYAPDGADKKVYRLYNTSNGDHLFTTNWLEYTVLRILPWWRGEGVGFNAK